MSNQDNQDNVQVAVVVAKTAEDRIREAQERRAKRNAEEKKARNEQHAVDLEAIEALETKLSMRITPSNQLNQFTQGVPVVVGVRAPNDAEYKRLMSKIGRAKENSDAKTAALIELARACWVYPEEEAMKSVMTDANPGLLASVGIFVNKLAEVEVREEGKE